MSDEPQNPISAETTPKDGQDSVPPSPTSFDSAQDMSENPSESFDHPQDPPPVEAPNEPSPEPQPEANQPTAEVSEPFPEPETAQMGRNEPLPANGEAKSEPVQTKAEATPPPVIQTSRNLVREILAKAQQAIQNKKRKKLDRILNMFTTKSKVTNDEVEKFLHVSDATATRYLSILEKEGKIKQNGKTGKRVSYSKIN